MKKLGIVSGITGAIIASVIFIEGGFTNDPYDPGGKTKYGITEQVAREYGYKGNIEDLTKEEATDIYNTLYVVSPHFDKVVEINPAIGHKLIDAGVNVGTARVSIWFQRALNSLGSNIKEDGVIGTSTLNAYRTLESRRGKVKTCELILKILDGYQTSYYLTLNSSRYITGWLDKRVENIPLTQCSVYNPPN